MQYSMISVLSLSRTAVAKVGLQLRCIFLKTPKAFHSRRRSPWMERPDLQKKGAKWSRMDDILDHFAPLTRRENTKCNKTTKISTISMKFFVVFIKVCKKRSIQGHPTLDLDSLMSPHAGKRHLSPLSLNFLCFQRS